MHEMKVRTGAMDKYLCRMHLCKCITPAQDKVTPWIAS